MSKDLFQWLHLVDKENLKDGSEKSLILRELLREVSINELEKFSNDSIDEKAPDSGLVLQDIVSEIGRRIGFEIEHGKYRQCPYDGIWKTSDSGGRTIVLEVKKNTTYQIDIQKLEKARKDIVKDRGEKPETVCGLIVIGHGKTDFVEAQIRGSKSAWSMRLISIEKLFHLLKLLHHEIEDPQLARKIRSILYPTEYTKLDPIIDLLFQTTAEMSSFRDIEAEGSKKNTTEDFSKGDTPKGGRGKGTKKTPSAVTMDCSEVISTHLGAGLDRLSRAKFVTSDNDHAVCIVVSKEHPGPKFWYGVFDHQLEWFETLDHENKWLAFACAGPEMIFMLPVSKFERWKENLGSRYLEDRDSTYWHVTLRNVDGGWNIISKSGKDNYPIGEYLIH